MVKQYHFKWNDQTASMLKVFEDLLATETLVDVTLACDGRSLKAHKLVLSACSSYLMSLFAENPCKHPIVIMKDIRYCDLKAIVEFMYRGVVIVSDDDLPYFVKTAETLKVKQLNGVTGFYKPASGIVQQETIKKNESAPIPPPVPFSVQSSDASPLRKRRNRERKRGRPRKRSKKDSKRGKDDGIPPKIKINFDITGHSDDASMDATDDDNRWSGNPVSRNSQSPVPMNSYQSTSQDLQGDESTSEYENEFEVEPTKSLEQATENVSTTNDNITEPITLASVSALEIARSSVICRSSGRKAFIPVSIPLDSLGFNLQGLDSPQAIHTKISSFNDPLMSPVADTSRGTDSSYSLYMEESGVASMPEQSNFQENSVLLPHDSQPQVNSCTAGPRRSRRLNVSPSRQRP